VRVLDAHKYEATQRLQQGCATLTDKVEQLNGLVRTYLDTLDKQVGSTNVSAVRQYSTFWHTAAHVQCLQAGKIEIEKLKAVGVRNAVATLEEVRAALHSAIEHNLSDAPEPFATLEIPRPFNASATNCRPCRTENASQRNCTPKWMINGNN